MDFQRKLKTRLYIAIGYGILGIFIIAVTFLFDTDSSFMSSFGFALTVCAAARIKKYFYITKDEKRMRQQGIFETDERNICIANKARSLSLLLYIYISVIGIIVSGIMNKTEISIALGLSVCVLSGLYLIIYFILSKKS